MKRKIGIALALILILTLGVSASFWDKLAETMMETIIPWIVRLMLYPLMVGSLWMLKAVLYFNPTVFCYGQPNCSVTPGLDSLYPYIMDILVPVYVVAMMFVALFFIVKAGSPRGRARARKMFFRLVMGMLMIIYAPLIYQAMLDISIRMTGFYLDSVSIDKLMALTSFGKAVAMCYLQCCMFIVAFVTIIILLVRWFYVYIYALFFPFILFLYFFEVTKPYGTKYLKQAIRWIFVPPLQALILYVMVQGPLVTLGSINPVGLPAILQGLFTQVVGVFVVLAGMITMCAAPMIMTQILEFVGTAVYSVGLAIDNLPLMGIGGVIAGQGPSAFTNAHGHFSRVRAYESYRAGMMGATVAKEAPRAMRMVGGETGAAEGRGGGISEGGIGEFGGEEEEYGGEAPARGAGGAAGTVEAISAERAAKRRGMPTATTSLGRELGKIRKSSKAVSSHMAMGPESTAAEGSLSSEDLEAARRSAAGGILSPEDLEAARESTEGAGLSPDDLAEERRAAEGKEGLLDFLGGRRAVATPLGSFASASPEAQSGTIGRTNNAVNSLLAAGASSETLNPFRGMVSDMREIHRMTIAFKKPDEIKEADTRVERDISERQKSLENNASIAREKLALMQKQFGEKESVKGEIAYLQRLLKTTKETENKLAPPKKKK